MTDEDVIARLSKLAAAAREHATASAKEADALEKALAAAKGEKKGA